MAVEFNESDTIGGLSKDQLSLMARSDHEFVIGYLEDRTIFDAHRIRLLMELGVIAAKQKLEELEREEGRLITHKKALIESAIIEVCQRSRKV